MSAIKGLFLLLIISVVTSCSAEQHYYKNAFKQQNLNLTHSDTLTFSFKGKTNSSQYWQGNLMAYHSNQKVKLVEYGKWTQYDPNNPEKIFTKALYDTLGTRLIIVSEIYSNNTKGLINRVTCNDTLINNIQVRKCDYIWYFENGSLNHEYSIVTFTNPNKGKKYGVETVYEIDGKVKSTKTHSPIIKYGSIN